jgi:exonuclease III
MERAAEATEPIRGAATHFRRKGLGYGSWNTNGGLDDITKLFDYALTITDVLGLQETKRELTLLPHRVISGEAPKKNDTGSGVAILLSERASSMLVASGCVGSRIVWCRLSGLSHDIICVNVYIPHKSRGQAPFQQDTLEQLRALLRRLRKEGKASDCLVLLGDFNSRLPRDLAGLTGRYALHPRADAGGMELLDIMRENHLTAASTRFCPSRRRSPRGSTTYIDNFKVGHQIDYILVSQDRFSGVTACKTTWEHTRHRWGFDRDHGLLEMRLRFKIRRRAPPAPPRPDLTSLSDSLTLEKFETALTVFERAAREAAEEEADSTAKDYRIMVGAIKAAQDTLPRLPTVKHQGFTPPSVATQTLFTDRVRILSELERDSVGWKDESDRLSKAICKAQRADKRAEIAAAADALEKASLCPNPRAVYQALGRIKRKPAHLRKRTVQPSRTMKSESEESRPFKSQEELVGAWKIFEEQKFSATPRETSTGRMPGLGPADRGDSPSDEDLESCLEALAGSKAVGPDGVPTELYRGSPVSKDRLFKLVRRICEEEDAPAAMIEGLFVTIFKNKGSQDDMTKYRCICLLNHAYKLLSSYLLLRLVREVGHSLPESQWGFRKSRGTRDAVALLREVMRWALKTEQSLIVTFIDFLSAFDTVSHKFLDEALLNAGASRKSRAIFRAI